MSDLSPRTPARHSVFVKLVVIMLVATISLLLVVGAFFSIVVSPKMIAPIYHLFDDYASRVAAAAPDREQARELARRLDLVISYEGPGGAWTTGEGTAPGRGYRVTAPAEDGGRYTLAWGYPHRMGTVHDVLATLLSVFVAAVVLATYLILRRLLRPMRWLGEGVARLAAGELDVRVRVATRDELGTLTVAFNQMVERVAAMIRARDRLLLDISHELRSPLTRLRVAVELEPESERRERMIADLAEMDAMIAELLELERLRDSPGLRRQERDLVPLLHEVAARFADRAPGIVITAPAVLLAELDAERIATLLRNLLDNAIQHSQPDSRPIELRAAEADGAVVLRVDDDGLGIAEGDLPWLFEPFFRADRSRSRASGGYGLGLSICKRIAEAHGGTITATRRVPRGASFVVTWPREGVATKARAPSPRLPDKSRPP